VGSLHLLDNTCYHFEHVEKIHEFSLRVQDNDFFGKNQNYTVSLVSRLSSLVSCSYIANFAIPIR